MPLHPKNITIQDFRYQLPESLVAQFPLANRDASKLLFYQRGSISDHGFREIPDLLSPEALLIFNDTKVVQARLLFTKPTGGIIEIFCLEPVFPYTEMQQAMQQTTTCSWQCLVGNAKRWKSGLLQMPLPTGFLQAELQERAADGFIIKFSWQPAALTFAEVLETAGKLPLPPYLNRDAEEADKIRYQTIYAATEGAVAAPTAGLHFTENILTKLTQRNIKQAKVTLHVGAGTFKPVKASAMADHQMHAEEIYVSSATIRSLQEQFPKSIIPVGTTSLRTLETLYWLGILIARNPELKSLHVPQWLPYEADAALPRPAETLQVLLDYLQANQLDYLRATTQLLIAPGYPFRICSGLVTNFHQPESTLLLLVSALIGEDWRRVYEHALENQYRFLSYGDSSLLLP
ncbi:S-adenosylmethionine:tRNA ribosyltransferase-isomerase [Adhaeribacter pallidiroseus]|uniref:S-adenosylmethionine:tRNA ribosyltransferase-isomerase n=1 Tax=Adhaeribacter pallidiroseus TaxID=2072847 RepID=A0A369QL37_9BACT|nr:S-adenosylmethionine:tRNA ribosyltransferase-isomerase [Adhaeribacter pallidiroseus]RDC65092.1 S-adenosylmethionine:tRNA ribosyltransferase-isomerase [Adhaeribacter pallidiroseus]